MTTACCIQSLERKIEAGKNFAALWLQRKLCEQQQGEIKSAYFGTGHKSFSIFTECCYLCDADGKLINENVKIISESNNHSNIFAFSSINKVFKLVREKHNLPLKVTFHVQAMVMMGNFDPGTSSLYYQQWIKLFSFNGTETNDIVTKDQ